MNKKFWIIICLTVALLGFSIFEMIYASTTTDSLRKELLALQTEISTLIENEETDLSNATEDTISLIEYWDERESILCLMFNHNDMKDLTKEIIQIRSYLEQEDLEEAYVHCTLAVRQVDSLTHLIDTTIQNIL